MSDIDELERRKRELVTELKLEEKRINANIRREIFDRHPLIAHEIQMLEERCKGLEARLDALEADALYRDEGI